MISVVSMVSGGLTSYEATKRAVERFGADRVTGLFADTMMEDEDLYRFLKETVEHLGIKLVRVSDGRNPWEVFEDERFIGNSRVDPCSKILKRQLMDRWVQDSRRNWDTILVFGLDWSERHRIYGGGGKLGHKVITEHRGWRPWYPLDEKPYLTKADIIAGLHAIGIEEPRLYKLGFPHNNCGGFCVKMGHAQARHLLHTIPERWAWHEAQEERLLATIPRTKPFLRFRGGGSTRRVSMRRFRELDEQQPMLSDDDGWGCGGSCGLQEEDSEKPPNGEGYLE